MILSLALLILLALMVISIELFIPLHLKIEMNGICRSYMFEIESEGSLSQVHERLLSADLTRIGLSDVNIAIESEGMRFGDRVTMLVKGNYKIDQMVNLFERKNDILTLKYERTFFVRKIIN